MTLDSRAGTRVDRHVRLDTRTGTRVGLHIMLDTQAETCLGLHVPLLLLQSYFKNWNISTQFIDTSQH